MAKVLVLYYSAYGHVEAMARAVAEGAREAGADVTIKRVPELVPEEVARKSGFKLDQEAPIATVRELPEYDASIFGTPTRFGNMCAQTRNFLDQPGGLWVEGKLVGKAASVFCSTGTQHGGQETTITTFHVTLCHLGFIIRSAGIYELGYSEHGDHHRRQSVRSLHPRGRRRKQPTGARTRSEACTLSGALRGGGDSEARRLTPN